ncbi:histone-lysine N-methyltransferase SETMAR [Nephila pilipes]|uniref:Histone-lysine N-methyltransferase SETMAR n=1 Tax=Nephila pilipes TaxID=299642 RepID=A0A8X6Q3C1_NEPPI|nr:histone-lysine N-methyltransferase SETMAR [Nephila pilipes]
MDPEFRETWLNGFRTLYDLDPNFDLTSVQNCYSSQNNVHLSTTMENGENIKENQNYLIVTFGCYQRSFHGNFEQEYYNIFKTYPDVFKNSLLMTPIGIIWSGDLSLCDEHRSGRPHSLDDEDLQAAIEEDSRLKCNEYAKQFNISDETIKLHLYLLGKMYRLFKGALHILLEVHKRQRVALCMSLLSHPRTASIFNLVLTSEEKWILYDIPKHSKHWLSRQDTVPHSEKPPMRPCKIILCIWLTGRQEVHY